MERGSIDRQRQPSDISILEEIKFTRQILHNASIFKRNASDATSTEPMTVTTRDYSLTEADLLPPSATNSPKHGRAYTTATGLDRGSGILKSAELSRDRRRSSNNNYGPNRIRKMTLADNIIIPVHHREPSMATFLTSPANAEFKRKKLSAGVAGLRIPRRWLSLRNVISFFNILILTVAILIVVLVSYFAGEASTRSAIGAMSNITMNDVTLKLDDMLNNADLVNTFTNSGLTGPSNTMSATKSNVRLFYAFMAASQNSIDQIYAVSPDGLYTGVSTFRNSNGSIDTDLLLVTYLNKTTTPYRVSFPVYSNCTVQQAVCYKPAFYPDAVPIANITYQVTDQSFYQKAISEERAGWSDVFLYSNRVNLGITSFLPVWDNYGALMFVAAADICLNTASDYLFQMCQLIAGFETQVVPSLLIFDSSGRMIASSDNVRYPVLTEDATDRCLVNSIHTIETDTVVNYLQNSFPTWDGIQWNSDGSPFVFDNSDSHIMIGNYVRGQGDLNWIIAAYVPFAAFNSRLLNAHFVQVPLASLAVLFVAMMFSIVITRAIGRPLKKIAEEMLRVADLNLNDDDEINFKPQPASHREPKFWKRWYRTVIDHEFDFIAFNELKELQYLNSAMIAMKSGLKSFSKYVPLDIVTLLMRMKREAVLGVDDVELTVFFSDIVNFTSVSEQVTPAQLVDIMSEYLSEMSNIILQNQGIVDKYIGDAVMAFWNAPLPLKDHATVACSVALKSQTKLAELRRKWMLKGYPEIKARIGLNTGNALVGNLGSTTRLNYTCLGDNVNLASRLEGANKVYGTSILISDGTQSRMNPEYFVTRPIDIVAVKGKTKATKIYELIGFRKLTSQSDINYIKLYETSFNQMCEGKFMEASSGFRSFLTVAGNAQDVTTLRHLRLCQEMITRAPSSRIGWTYCTILEEK